MKKTLIILGLWVAAVVLIAALVVSMGYSFLPEALFIGVQFLPGVLAARFFLSKISFRSRKAGIGQWEDLLGDNFLRVHRSYLVNTTYANLTSPDTVTVGTAEFPVSRKYKEEVQTILASRRA